MRTRKQCRLPVVILLLATGAPGLMAQSEESTEPTRIPVGSDLVDGSFIQPYKNRWLIFEVDSDGARTDGGSWTDELTLIEHLGKPALHRKQVVYDSKGTVVNTSEHTAYLQTLVPIRAHYSSPAGKGSVAVDGTHVKATFNQTSGPPIQIDAKLEMAGFDWNIFGTLLLAFPLEVGFHGAFPSFSLDPFNQTATIQWHEYEVTENKTIQLSDGSSFSTRVVEVAPNFRFFLSKESPYIIQLIMTTGAGSCRIWEMAPSDAARGVFSLADGGCDGTSQRQGDGVGRSLP